MLRDNEYFAKSHSRSFKTTPLRARVIHLWGEAQSESQRGGRKFSQFQEKWKFLW